MRGDIRDSDADVIVQQCNAVTHTSLGLAATIASRFKYADIYSKRSGRAPKKFDAPDEVGTAIKDFARALPDVKVTLVDFN